MCGDRLVDRGIVPDDAAAKIGGDGTGRYGVDCDLSRPQLASHVACQCLDGCFNRAVANAVGHREAGEAGGYIHDAAAVVHERQQFLRQEKWPLEVDGVESVHVFFSDRFQARGR